MSATSTPWSGLLCACTSDVDRSARDTRARTMRMSTPEWLRVPSRRAQTADHVGGQFDGPQLAVLLFRADRGHRSGSYEDVAAVGRKTVSNGSTRQLRDVHDHVEFVLETQWAFVFARSGHARPAAGLLGGADTEP